MSCAAVQGRGQLVYGENTVRRRGPNPWNLQAHRPKHGAPRRVPGAARIGGLWTFDEDKLAAFVKQRERDAEALASNVVPFPTPAKRQTRARTSAAYDRLMAGRYGANAA